MASSTPYWISGLSTSGSISFGCAFVAGRKRVPSPAAGKTALRTFGIIKTIVSGELKPAEEIEGGKFERITGERERGHVLQTDFGVGGKAPGGRIDHPDVGHSPGKIFFKLPHQVGVAVIRRKYFDRDQRRLIGHALFRLRPGDHADVGNPKH